VTSATTGTAGTTASTDGARAHARAQAGVAGAGTRIPETPADVPPGALAWAESVPAGSYTTRVLARGTRLRLIDTDGDGCAHLLLFRADAPWERLNVADTMKVPWQAYLGAGLPLLSDQGRVLATVVADTSGQHDNLCGMTAEGQAAMLLAALKHGLDARDVAPSVALFQGVRVSDDGGLQFTGSAGPGAAVDLLIHLPVVVALVNSPHPLAAEAGAGPIDVIAWRAAGELTSPVNDDPEYLRALFNTESTWAAATYAEEAK
jgi:uncharacterized protein YcgI (DUF1989 family)